MLPFSWIVSDEWIAFNRRYATDEQSQDLPGLERPG
jgi:hypothetical protein